MIDVDGLVRQVLADLGFAQSVALVPTPHLKQKVETNPGELRLQVKVLTLSDLQEQLGHFRRLIVPEKTLITPSVRDELRKRNVELCFDKFDKFDKTEKKSQSDQVSQNAQNSQDVQSLQSDRTVKTVKSGHERPVPRDSQRRVWFGLHLIKQEPSGLLEFLQKRYAINRQFHKCVLDLMQEAESVLIDHPQEMLGIVLTPHSALAMCAGNRHTAIRAVLGTEINLLQKDTREIGANLLVLDPNRSNPYKTRELVKTFLNEGPQNGPEYL